MEGKEGDVRNVRKKVINLIHELTLFYTFPRFSLWDLRHKEKSSQKRNAEGVFRRLRTATQGSALRNRKPLKRLDLNFKNGSVRTLCEGVFSRDPSLRRPTLSFSSAAKNLVGRLHSRMTERERLSKCCGQTKKTIKQHLIAFYLFRFKFFEGVETFF